jgi:hypothetical protein
MWVQAHRTHIIEFLGLHSCACLLTHICPCLLLLEQCVECKMECIFASARCKRRWVKWSMLLEECAAARHSRSPIHSLSLGTSMDLELPRLNTAIDCFTQSNWNVPDVFGSLIIIIIAGVVERVWRNSLRANLEATASLLQLCNSVLVCNHLLVPSR